MAQWLSIKFFRSDGSSSSLNPLSQPEIPRSDAGLGLVLQGDGSGKLTTLSNDRSGVRVFGEQRSVALADFNEDGRVDMVVTQNAASTKLYENQAAKPGLRVRLTGPEGNPAAVGAVLRLQSEGNLGPAREIHGGSGYWGADSPVTVLGSSRQFEKIWIRWPGGSTTTVSLEGERNAREVSIDWKRGVISRQ